MTEEELQQIRERAEGAYHLHVMDTPLDTAYPDIAHDYHVDVTALLAEVERLREIVQAVANGPADSSTYLCNYCDEYIGGIFGKTEHTPECPVTKARAILAEK